MRPLKPRTGEDRVCPICQKGYYVELNLVKKGKGRYCGKACYDASKRGRPSPTKGRKMPFRPHPWKRGQVPRSAFKKGHVTWNTGKTGIPSKLKGRKTGRVPVNAIKKGERRGAQTEFKKGERTSPETEFKKGTVPWNRDQNDNSPEKQARRERSSPRTVAWAKAVKERDNYTCQICGERGGRLHSDHILPYIYFPELRHDLANGRALCAECHATTPTYGGRWRSRRIQEFFNAFFEHPIDDETRFPPTVAEPHDAGRSDLDGHARSGVPDAR